MNAKWYKLILKPKTVHLCIYVYMCEGYICCIDITYFMSKQSCGGSVSDPIWHHQIVTMHISSVRNSSNTNIVGICISELGHPVSDANRRQAITCTNANLSSTRSLATNLHQFSIQWNANLSRKMYLTTSSTKCRQYHLGLIVSTVMPSYSIKLWFRTGYVQTFWRQGGFIGCWSISYVMNKSQQAAVYYVFQRNLFHWIKPSQKRMPFFGMYD